MNALYSGNTRSALIGLVAIFLTWITAATSVPIVKILGLEFSAEEILVLRATFCITAAFVLARGRVWRVHRNIYIAGCIIGISSVSFYRALEAWNVSSVAVVITCLPIVSVVIALVERKHVPKSVIVGLISIVIGTAWALEPWHEPVVMKGLLWTLLSLTASPIGFEFWARAPETTTVPEKCFWFAAFNIIFGVAIIACTQGPIDLAKYMDPQGFKLLAIFGAIATVYVFCSIIPFDRVGRTNVATACVLMQGGTPATLVGAYLILGEELTASQWVGVSIAIIGAAVTPVQIYLANRSNTDHQPSA